MEKWTPIYNEDKITTPGLLINPDFVNDNIKSMIKICGDPERLWPHIKTYKMKKIIDLQINNGISRFKCATVSEAKLLCSTKADHILLAIQPTRKKLDFLLKLQKEFPEKKFSTLVDNKITLELFIKASISKNQKISVWIDLNTGMNRTGVIPNEHAFNLFKQIFYSTHLNFLGLHVYDGHVRDPDEKKREKMSNESDKKLNGLIEKINSVNSNYNVIVGGSPTFQSHSKNPNVFLSPGTTLLWDARYSELCPKSPFKIAALLATRVISKPGPNLLCLDIGHKAIACEMKLPRMVLLGLKNSEQISQSEEHLVVESIDSEKYEVGDVIYGAPFHICPTVAKYNYAQIVKNQRLVDYWKIEGKDYMYSFEDFDRKLLY